MTKKDKTRRSGWALWAALALAVGLLTACASSNAASDAAPNATSGAASAECAFTFSDSGITASGGGTGYQIDGTHLTLTAAGTYTLNGTCSDGSVTVKKGTTGVKLVLDGLTLTSADTAPISCNKSTEVTIEAASGTVNTLADSGENNDETHPDNANAENAVIKCKDGSQVILCGAGTLNLNANGKNGIKSGASTQAEGEASLTIREVALNITAPVNDAINAEQLLNLESGTLTISAEDDAIHSDLYLNIGADHTAGPSIDIQKSCEGIEAAELNIYSGDISILSSDDCINAANSDLSGYSFSMTISGGTIYAYSSSGDGFDSNGSLTISGGNVEVWTASTADNQPLDADGTVTISGGTVLAAGGSGGMGMGLTATQPYVIFGSAGRMGGGMGGHRPEDMGGQRPEGMEAPEGMERPDGMGGPRLGGMEGKQPGDMGGQQPGGTAQLVPQDGTLSIQSDAGDTVYSAAAPCNVSYVFFSCDSVMDGGAYTLHSESGSAASATAQTGVSAGQQPGGMGGQPPMEMPPQ